MNVDELEGVDLDLAVALALGYKAAIKEEGGWRSCFVSSSGTHEYVGHEGWFLGGHVIKDHRISLQYIPGTPGRDDLPEFWSADMWIDKPYLCPESGNMEPQSLITGHGPDPLTAAMRCFVKAKLPDSPPPT